MVLKDIPGFAEAMAAAQEAEAAIRDSPFLDGLTTLCGITVRHLSWRHYLLLSMAGSPFIAGGACGVTDVAQFLLIVSPEFRDPEKHPQIFGEISRKVDFETAADEIREFVDHALLDVPRPARGDTSESIVSIFASVVHTIASTYGTGADFAQFRDKILDLPIIEVSQYSRLILRDRYPGIHFGNAITAAERSRLVNEALAAEAAKNAQSAGADADLEKPALNPQLSTLNPEFQTSGNPAPAVEKPVRRWFRFLGKGRTVKRE